MWTHTTCALFTPSRCLCFCPPNGRWPRRSGHLPSAIFFPPSCVARDDALSLERVRFPGGVLENTAVSSPSLTSPPALHGFAGRHYGARMPDDLFSHVKTRANDTTVGAARHTPFSFPDPAPSFHGTASEIRWKTRTAGGRAHARTHAQGPRARSPGVLRWRRRRAFCARASLGKERDGGDTERAKTGKTGTRTCFVTLARQHCAPLDFHNGGFGSRQNRKSNRFFILRVPTTTCSRYRRTFIMPRPTCLYWNKTFLPSPFLIMCCRRKRQTLIYPSIAKIVIVYIYIYQRDCVDESWIAVKNVNWEIHYSTVLSFKFKI